MAPIRTCIGCGTKRPATELMRYARDADGTISAGRNLPGRGAWVCLDSKCLKTAVVKGAFARAFRTSVRREALDALLDEQSHAS